MKKTFKIALICSVLLASNLEEVAWSAQNSGISRTRYCKIELDDVHLSSSLEKKYGDSFIKANADALCIVSMDQMVIAVEIWKEGLIQNHKVHADNTFYTEVPVKKVMPNKITATKCKNGMLGIYYARAKVTGISKGSTVSTTWIESPHHSLICCGT